MSSFDSFPTIDDMTVQLKPLANGTRKFLFICRYEQITDPEHHSFHPGWLPFDSPELDVDSSVGQLFEVPIGLRHVMCDRIDAERIVLLKLAFGADEAAKATT